MYVHELRCSLGGRSSIKRRRQKRIKKKTEKAPKIEWRWKMEGGPGTKQSRREKAQKQVTWRRLGSPKKVKCLFELHEPAKVRGPKSFGVPLYTQ